MRFSVFASALVAVLVGLGSSLAIVVAAARNLGADGAEVSSWVGSLCFGMGVAGISLSLWHRIPVVTAWSLAGAILIAAMPPGMTMAAATGAFLLSGLLMLLAGAVPQFGALVARLPGPVGAAMLAGLLLRFVLEMFRTAQAEPLLVLPLLGVFLVARGVHAASAPLVVIVAGLPFAWVLGHAMPGFSFAVAVPRLTMPGFDVAGLVGLGLPLFLVTMATQQIPGTAVLRAAGYVVPVRSILVVTGGLTMLLGPFGGYSTNLSSVTAAICTGPETHPDPAQRWQAGVVYGVVYLMLAVFGAGFAAMLAGFPPALLATVVGAALLGPLTNALQAANSVPGQRFAAVVAFTVTASGVTLLGLGGAFWGLLGGMVVLGVERFWGGRGGGAIGRAGGGWAVALSRHVVWVWGIGLLLGGLPLRGWLGGVGWGGV